ITATAMLARGELGGGAVVGTVMTNLGLEKALKERGLGLRRAAVGDRFVHEDMVASGCNLGGEQSGHVIFLDEAPTGDGQLSALQVLRALSESGQSLKDAAAQLVRAPQRLINVRVPERRALDELTRYGELVATWQEKLTDVGRMLVRYSGTEPLVRVMVEGHDEEMVERCAEELADCLADELGGQR
ncbi:MAG: phosphoglucosamine mutase, partial [Acidobacteriota bacterium]